ncbi:AsnC family transcriptional regulator [Microbacterium marinilacus]|uniref:Lrp/AsnC family transcriptional regulator n=1 Tax=Microbacterium marinilacus TaxID=415209 RepID=A0ABP7BE00_9MICO|nr:AsnC family transcriptional regulator [Microbacterium marinilacus]MBY0689304.1 AsnC family transcriptional regulator [Microbacterium marinilacus]
MDEGDRFTDVRLSESDLALIDAMQDDPRAAWARIGAAVGVSAPTARRRWQRLVDADAAWITSHPGWASGVVTALIAVQCRAGHADATARDMVRLPEVMTVAAITGDHDLLLTVFVDDMRGLRRLAQGVLAAHEGVARVRTMLMTRVFRDGSHWRAGSSGGARTDEGRRPGGSLSPAAVAAAVAVLERDGRAPSADLARALGTSEAHARRLVQRGVREELIVQRVDVRLDQPHWPHWLVLWMVVPAAQLHETALRISRLPLARVCAALAGGSANLYTVVWLRSLSEAPDVEAQIVRGHDVHVTDRSILLHYSKRMGHVFDDDQHHVGHVPWAPEPG